MIDPEYYDSPHWRSLRLEVLAGADYRCAKCRQHRAWLHVHHLTYERLGAERLEDVQPLCPNCHAREHPHRASEILAEWRTASEWDERDPKAERDVLEEMRGYGDGNWTGEGDDPPM
jgi:5-methylcytosine-specific restriction endonuclease McrA